MYILILFTCDITSIIKSWKFDNFSDFSSDIVYNIKTDIFRDVIYLIINQCEPRGPKDASGEHKVSASAAAEASEERLFYFIHVMSISYKQKICI